MAREGKDSAIGGFSIGIIDYLDAGLERGGISFLKGIGILELRSKKKHQI